MGVIPRGRARARLLPEPEPPPSSVGVVLCIQVHIQWCYKGIWLVVLRLFAGRNLNNSSTQFNSLKSPEIINFNS